MSEDANDIVLRLRGQYAIGPDAEYGFRDYSDACRPIDFEAAIVIEQLRVELGQFRNLSQILQKENLEFRSELEKVKAERDSYKSTLERIRQGDNSPRTLAMVVIAKYKEDK